jgi:hypothetical protein
VLDGVFVSKTSLAGRMFLPFGVYANINPMTATSTPYAATIDRAITYKSLSYCVYASPTNNGSNYWDIKLVETLTGAVVKTLSTSGVAAGYNLLTTVTFDIASSDASDKGLYISCVKVGAPGSLDLFGPSLEVEV